VTEQVLWLLLWGTVVGLDLATIGQVMVSRPLVAGTVAGAIVGDPLAGSLVGGVLELFALDVLPVGASRYPDYGLGAVAAAAVAANAPGVLGTGIAVCAGLVTAYLGELGASIARRGNTSDVRRYREALDAGEFGTVRVVQMRGIARDVARSLVVTAVGLILAAGIVVYHVPPMTLRGAILVTVLVIGAAMGAAGDGVLRMVGERRGLWWFGVGVAVGLAWVVVT
jgi:PTS system mannose-specific IIC component